MEDKYRNSYDDPYKILAASLAARLNINCAKRILSDRDYIRQLVQEEVRESLDVPGVFCDCVVTELISEKQKVLYRDALNQLGLFFFHQLDVARLRDELRKFYKEFGIEL